MAESRIQALDALSAARSDLLGMADALAARATLEGDDLAAMLARVADSRAETLLSVRTWLESEGDRR